MNSNYPKQIYNVVQAEMTSFFGGYDKAVEQHIVENKSILEDDANSDSLTRKNRMTTSVTCHKWVLNQ